MLDAGANVVSFRPVPFMIGHNQPPISFDDDVASVLATGALAICLDRLCEATLDPRLQRSDVAVLAVLIQHLNYATGMAWPSRETIALRSRLTVKTVHNALYELRSLGYVAWERRRADGQGRNLLHYTLSVARKPKQQLLAEINAYLAALPSRESRGSNTAPTRGTNTAPGEGMPQARAKNCPGWVEKTAPSDGVQEHSTKELLEVTLSRVAREPERELKLALDQPQQKPSAFDISFDEVWSGYPRKVAKEAARKAFTAATKRERAETIIAAVQAFAAKRRGQDPQFTPHLASWLNQDRWNDEPEQATSTPATAGDARRRISGIVGRPL